MDASLAGELCSVYESAAKILFVSIKWVKSVPSFVSLPPSDQLLLLEAAWSTIFVINIAQWNVNLDEGKSLLKCS